MRIPVEARSAFGGITEYVRSFGDVSRREAEQLANFHRGYCTRLISEARGKSQPGQRVAELIRIKRVPDHDEIERTVRKWVIDCERRAAASHAASPEDTIRDLSFLDAEIIRQMRLGRGDAPLTTQWIAADLIQRNDWAITDPRLKGFVEDRVARGQRELAARIKTELSWDDAPQPTHRIFAPAEFQRDQEHRQSRSAPVSIRTILDGYLAERKPAASTVKAWTSAINSLVAHLGHDDASQVTPEAVIAWKDALLAGGDVASGSRGQMTVRHKYLGAIKPVFGWATRNKLIPENPVVGVTVIVPKRVRTRGSKGFTDAEAKKVLSAALAIDTNADRSFRAFARRWLPWLCAYTGARVGEMTQLRHQDVARNEEGIWHLTITPEAGSQKGGFTRQVALHPHLIEQGFLEAIKERSGPLFYDPSRRRTGSVGNPQHKKVAQRVAEWVRHTVALTDPELQPNHGWRHRFITIAKDIGMDGDIRRAIVGHAAVDEHGDYGDTLIRSSYRALENFPRYVVGECASGGCSSDPREILQPVATAAE